ncbi:hypothetical protein [Nonomuraea sp. NPDC003804]|uniref:hypothetical protein n=1 Tax=Nonomuraea sp. NPDC003804 TaxID=3154547 RepID=UPI0033B566E9
MVRWLGPDGYEVEHILLNGRPCLRVSHWVRGTRYLIDYCWSVKAVGRLVPLAELEEVAPVVDLAHARAKRRSRDRARQ